MPKSIEEIYFFLKKNKQLIIETLLTSISLNEKEKCIKSNLEKIKKIDLIDLSNNFFYINIHIYPNIN